ncbi:NAD(P)-dependent oxidoreductase [Lichenihabitans sp. PAMC28606]|uniref:NAD(P)-dependent oxidoreductase n=1 Tax=Lichenihabitans sp. PAMC28606 TaxID=2880932 RepID=UPI001D09EE0E|nr:NAD(P)-dependent oxidoreductase [Lichenihabitans sp. PAMC28606]UDL95185.1 NAD(P)-dependent oxidoreductase [Lichenihabitans sp. PAMC28606]
MEQSSEMVTGGRLSAEQYARNFADLTPPLTRHEAFVESDRCYFCYDAPCQNACPTKIDIPLFIRQIAADNAIGAAETILSANIMGGMCARVCPVETLCEEACVREHAEHKPVHIGLLQRHATDAIMKTGQQPFRRGPETGRRVAVVGAGPAGLACAHRLAQLGHAVTLLDAKPKLGGLNEYGIATYKAVDDFAQREVDFILSIGRIEARAGVALGRDFDLASLRAEYDAVFLGLGLAGFNALEGMDEAAHVVDAVGFIEQLRQASDKSTVAVGRRVVVIGGGMTAVDAAVQSKKLGAEEVTIVYRRGPEHMKASLFEQELAQRSGVTIRHWASPAGFEQAGGRVSAALFAQRSPSDAAGGTVLAANGGSALRIEADMVLLAIGQSFIEAPLGQGTLALSGGRIVIDDDRRTSLPGVWAGGDCVAGGQDLTVSAVEDGKQAALSIDRLLQAAQQSVAGHEE